tara:strand:- start:8 stop:334 length:327 start_codon:yes stop_codon:yes gene_type:complete
MESRNYIKNPVKISTILPKVFKRLKKKNDGPLLEIKLNWEKIVTKKISSICFVSSLNIINNKKTLTIVSDSRKIQELSYSSKEIQDKINSYFSTTVVNEIKFKKSLQN